MEWENPGKNFQPNGAQKMMLDFDPLQDTSLFDRLRNWTERDRTLAFKSAVFRQLELYINPRIPPAAVQGIRIQQATLPQIKEFFANVRSAARPLL